MMTTTTEFKDVKATYEGGEGVPSPLYLLTYRGRTLHVLGKGEMRDALNWIAGRDRFAAVIVQIDGVGREIARGTEPAMVL